MGGGDNRENKEDQVTFLEFYRQQPEINRLEPMYSCRKKYTPTQSAPCAYAYSQSYFIFALILWVLQFQIRNQHLGYMSVM